MKQARIEKRDELKIFLDEMVVAHNSELIKNGVIQWWKTHEVIYPNLAKMARDYLCISAAGVERFFSSVLYF